MEVYARVRRAVQVDGMSIRQAAREFGLSRKTIRKMLAYSVPPSYERKKPVLRPPGCLLAPVVAIGGVEQKAHFLCMDLAQSDDCFVIAFPAEDTEAFLRAADHPV